MKKRKAPIKVVIPRNKWLRGTGKGTLLVNKEYQTVCKAAKLGHQCCLGFYCEVKGVPRRDMGNKGVPGDFLCAKWANADWLDDAARINDSTMYDDVEREKMLRALAGKHHVKFEFVDSAKATSKPKTAKPKAAKPKKTSKSTGKGTRTGKSGY